MGEADRRFFPELEALRGVAALLVAFFHAGGVKILVGDKLIPLNNPGRIPHVEPELAWRLVDDVYWYTIRGAAAPFYPSVLLFYVLSGFVLAGSLQRDGSPYRFVAARAFRIYPALWFCFFSFCVLYFTTGWSLGAGAYDPWNIAKHIPLIANNINGVTWTIQNELLAIPFIYAGYLLYRYVGLWSLVAAVLIGMYFSPADPVRSLVMALGGTHRIGWMWLFLIGMVAFYVGHHAAKLKPLWAAAIGLVCIFGFFCSTMIVTAGNPWRQIIEGVSVAVFCAIVAYGPRTWIVRMLHAPLIRFYGTISYSFYLLHPLTLPFLNGAPEVFTPIIEAGVPWIVVKILAGVLSVALITPLAWFSYKCVERPGVRLGRMLVLRREPQLQAA